MGDRTLGGIGRLFINDKLLSEVYYCVQQDRPNTPIYGLIVFLAAGLEIPNDTTAYKLYSENNRCYIILTLFKDPTERFTPTLALQTMAHFILPDSHLDLDNLLQQSSHRISHA